jgi:stage II sporulation protein AA (anti-sigma F factor antagonist)
MKTLVINQRHCAVDSAIEVVALQGRLAAENEAQLTAALQKALSECVRSLILDMSAVDFVSSAGLRVLYMIYSQAVKEGKHLAMFGVQPGVYKILKIVASEATFHVCDSEEDATKSWPT